MSRIKFMNTEIDNLTMQETLQAIDQLIQENRSAYVVTPNVDHIVQLETSKELKAVYENASLILTDGKPLLWIAKWYGTPIKEKISGSDLFPRLCNMAAKKGYKLFFLGAAEGKTAKSILISCGARLAPFDIKELRDLMAYDEMELDMLGDQRTAMFVIISDTDDTFNFVVSILYTQLFNLLCDKADDEHGGRLPYHVRLLLDEFANIGQIPKFDKLIATIRSREISASIILQSQSQLKTIYKDAAETIIGNCDTMLFLGGKESSTLKEISETLGKETIDLYNTSDTRGNSPSFGTNYQKTGKDVP